MAGLFFLGAVFVVCGSGVRFEQSELNDFNDDEEIIESVDETRMASGQEDMLSVDAHRSRACLARVSLYEDSRVVRLLNKSRPISMIQIGANDGCPDKSNDPVVEALKRPNMKALLLEPNPAVFKQLQANLEQQFGTTPRLAAAQEAVCPDKTGTVAFYVVTEQFAKDFPKAPHYAKYELSSMSEHQITKHWDHLQSFLHSEEHFRRYVKAEQVPCFAPKDLMKHHSMQPSSVDLLMVDAEGFDGPIVSSFMEVDGFDPEMIIFEQIHLKHETLSHVLTVLEGRGYVHDCTRRLGHKPKCPAMNVFASKERLY